MDLYIFDYKIKKLQKGKKNKKLTNKENEARIAGRKKREEEGGRERERERERERMYGQMSPPCQFYNTGFIHFKPSLYNYHAEVI